MLRPLHFRHRIKALLRSSTNANLCYLRFDLTNCSWEKICQNCISSATRSVEVAKLPQRNPLQYLFQWKGQKSTKEYIMSYMSYMYIYFVNSFHVYSLLLCAQTPSSSSPLSCKYSCQLLNTLLRTSVSCFWKYGPVSLIWSLQSVGLMEVYILKPIRTVKGLLETLSRWVGG